MVKKPRFRIKLNEVSAADPRNLTPYAVAKRLGLNKNTVNKYLTEEVETDELLSHVLQLAEFFGADWRDPDVIEVIEEGDVDEEIENPLAVPA